MRARSMLNQWVIPLAVTAFVVGPLAHMALHQPDHHHTPDGAVVFADRANPHHLAHGHPHTHGVDEHTHGSDVPGHATDASERSTDPPHHPTHHGDGGAAHLGLAPPPPAPVLLTRRALRGPPAAPRICLPAYRPLRGHRYTTRARARAPPA